MFDAMHHAMFDAMHHAHRSVGVVEICATCEQNLNSLLTLHMLHEGICYSPVSAALREVLHRWKNMR